MVAFTGALAIPAAAHAASVAPAALLETAQDAEPVAPDPAMPAEPCLANTICSMKDRVRWGTAAWKPAFCQKIAHGVLDSAKRNGVSPSLLLAVMLEESDMNEHAAPVTMKNGRIYAKDSGLMGIRCVLDNRGYCTNAYVKGMSWRKVMDPVFNIELGARELARWRTGGVTKVTVHVRKDGHLVEKQKFVPCHHKTHAFWAHYNHGPQYIDHGPARHYPHRVAVLEYEIARALNVDAPELREVPRITMHDKGQRDRTADRPVEPRNRKLCSEIREVGGQCANVATLAVTTSPVN